jgi:(p)ppGpp synthase/HD superfamily hydrolase
MSDRFAEAFEYAAELHQEQTRKGTEIPYLSHLMAVAALVMENGGDEDQAIAALLHDGPEDQGGRDTLEEIRQRFGERVASIVEGCTDTFEIPKPRWKPRKLGYLEHLRTAPDEVLLVSLADKVHNLRSIARDYQELGESLWERFTASRDETLWYYETLLEIFTRRSTPQLAPLVDQLRRTLDGLSAAISEAGSD